MTTFALYNIMSHTAVSTSTEDINAESNSDKLASVLVHEGIPINARLKGNYDSPH